MSGAILAAGHAGPGPAAHLALLGIVVVIGVAFFAVSRWRRRREGETVDELDGRDLSSGHETPEAHSGQHLEQRRHQTERHGDAAEEKHHAGPH